MTKRKSFWVKAKFSTDFNTYLGHLTNKIATGFEKSLFTGMILIDLQKAFGNINLQILIKKMKYLGFSKKVIAWFKLYLNGQKFKIKPKLVTPAHRTCVAFPKDPF